MKAKLLQFKFLFYAFAIIIVSSFLLSYAYRQVSAEEYVDDWFVEQTWNEASSGGLIQDFKPNADTMVGLELSLCKLHDTLNTHFHLSICEGTFATTTPSWLACGSNASIKIYEGIWNDHDVPDCTGDGPEPIYFPMTPFSVTAGNWYYWHITEWYDNFGPDTYMIDYGTAYSRSGLSYLIDYNYGGGTFILTAKTDQSYYFQTYSDTEAPPNAVWPEEAGYSSWDLLTGACDQSTGVGCINIPAAVTCVIDNPARCMFPIKYNSLAYGSAYIYPDTLRLSTEAVKKAGAIATGTLPQLTSSTTIGNVNIQLPTNYTASSTTVNVYVNNDDWGDIDAGHTDIEWVYNWEIAGKSDGSGNMPIMYDVCGSVCDDIASSSSATDLAFYTYYFQCSGKTLMCWSFQPSQESLDLLAKTNTIVTKQFPVSIGFQFYNVVNTLASGSSTAVGSIDVPLKWWDPTTGTYKDTGANFLTATTFQTGMGSTLYDFYWLWSSRLLYIIGFIYLFNRIMRLIGGSNFSVRIRSGKSSTGLGRRAENYWSNRIRSDVANKRE